jgi:nucleoside-triphosphatase
MIKNILITGLPRSGKSSLLDKAVSGIIDKVGFVTKEIRLDGQRTGFEIQTHLGRKTILASIDFTTPYKVSRYFVSVQNLNSVIPEVSRFTDNDILYIDEIGQMELFSDNFKDLVIKFLDSKNIFLATITQVYTDKFVEDIKNRKDIVFVELTAENSSEKERLVTLLIKKLKKQRNTLR